MSASGLRLRLQSQHGSIRRYVYNLLHTPENDCAGEQGVKIFLASVVVLSVAAIALETVESIQYTYGAYLRAFEYVAVTIFTIEYGLRVWSSVEDSRYRHPFRGRIRFLFSFFALIDVVAILPFYLPSLVTFDLIFLRAIRLLLFLRLLKLGEYSTSLNMISSVARAKKHDIGISLGVLLILVVIFSFLLYFFEHQVQADVVTNIPMTLWWGIAKLTELTYVEIVPLSIGGRICDVILSFLGLSFFALPSGILAAGFIEEINKKHRNTSCNHCGNDPHSPAPQPSFIEL